MAYVSIILEALRIIKKVIHQRRGYLLLIQIINTIYNKYNLLFNNKYYFNSRFEF